MDPPKKRVAELAQKLREGAATDAEREELALYAEEESEVRALVKRAEDERGLGGNWLARTEADKRLTAAESTVYTTAERNVGVGLVVVGGIGMFFFPPAGFAMVVGGALLAWSVLRVKIKTLGKDPYEDIEQ